VTAGQSIVLNALAVGGLPLRCQWYRDGEPLAGKTNQWLAFAAFTRAMPEVISLWQ